MKKLPFSMLVVAVVVLFLSPVRLYAGGQQFFNLGELQLESGGVIRNCVLGYRTFGSLNKKRSNAVLFPTWFMGTSQQIEAFIGPDKMIDDKKYFVIAVDSFGNGVSSSPSRSLVQQGKDFPEFSIGDMVRAQHRLVTERFGISRLHAVIGVSMGGMQTFHWLAAYPDMMKKAVPITGTPKVSSYELLFCRTALAVLQGMPVPREWDERSRDVFAGIYAAVSYTPDYFLNNKDPEAIPSYLEKRSDEMGKNDPDDLAWQLKAIERHDIFEAFGESIKSARAQVFIVLSARDHLVNPKPAIGLAGTIGAELMVLESDCGHLIFECEQEKIFSAVSRFLNR